MSQIRKRTLLLLRRLSVEHIEEARARVRLEAKCGLVAVSLEEVRKVLLGLRGGERAAVEGGVDGRRLARFGTPMMGCFHAGGTGLLVVLPLGPTYMLSRASWFE